MTEPTGCSPQAGSFELPALVCGRCGRLHPAAALAWRCEACAGLLDVAGSAFPPSDGRAGPPDDRAPLSDPAAMSMWRYADVLPVPYDPRISMGEGMTPLLPSRAHAGVLLKCDFLMPTSSFKDRGAAVLATAAARLAVRRAVVDSSGNAGTSAAAYFGRAGIRMRVLVPEATSAGKLAQMRAHGAEVTLVPGDRAATAAAALEAASEPGVLYASHVYHPYFVHGVKTYGYELWEQLGRRLPETVVVPVGNGTMVLGCALAFHELQARGLVATLPKIVAVQSAGCAPLASAWVEGRKDVKPAAPRPTVAEGIAISAPPRAPQILQAVRSTRGSIVTVEDEQVLRAQAALAKEGLFVEPTSAVCYAAVDQARNADDRGAGLWSAGEVVVPLCGSGLKTGKPTG
jgi:threonine synthase